MTAEAGKEIFTEKRKKFYLNLKEILRQHYIGRSNYLLVIEVNIYHFKPKDSKFNAYPVFSRNILKDFAVDNMKQTGLNMCMIFRLVMKVLMLMIIYIFINI